MFSLDESLVVKALADCPVAPLAKETALPLVETWIARFYEEDSKRVILGVEVPWFMWLDPHTLVVGVIDEINSKGVCEWKTAKEPKRNKDGTESAYWNETVWYDELTRGSQVAIYALANKKATFIDGNNTVFDMNRAAPSTVFVRAAVKSVLPRFWPSDYSRSLFTFTQPELEAVENALLVKAAAIRAARATGKYPWQLTGKHCQNRFNETMCPLYETVCVPKQYLTGSPPDVFDKSDPGYRALEEAGVNPMSADSELVVLSASAYETSTECLEKYRNIAGGYFAEEESFPMQVGTAFHAGIAAYERQLMGRQRNEGSEEKAPPRNKT